MVTRTASTAGELTTALNASAANDIVELQTGNFGSVTITNSYAAPGVIIRGGAGQDPTLSRMSFVGADYITVEGLEIISSVQADGSTGGPVSVDGTSSYIIFDGCTAKGPSAANYLGGYCVNFQSGSDHCEFKNGILGQLRIGLVCITATNVYFGYNVFLNVGEDAIKGFGDNFTVEYNHFPNSYFGGVGDHPDGIQCNNSVNGGYIGYNIMAGANSGIQCIFFGGGPAGQDHSNIIIEHNICFGQLNLGIAVKSGLGHTSSGVIIRNNTVGFLRATNKKATYITWPGATVQYCAQMHSNNEGLSNGVMLAMEEDFPDGPYGINKYYNNIRRDVGYQLLPADFAPVGGSLVDPATQGASTYGAHETIAAWIAAGTWPAGAPIPDPDPIQTLPATVTIAFN